MIMFAKWWFLFIAADDVHSLRQISHVKYVDFQASSASCNITAVRLEIPIDPFLRCFFFVCPTSSVIRGVAEGIERQGARLGGLAKGGVTPPRWPGGVYAERDGLQRMNGKHSNHAFIPSKKIATI